MHRAVLTAPIHGQPCDERAIRCRRPAARRCALPACALALVVLLFAGVPRPSIAGPDGKQQEEAPKVEAGGDKTQEEPRGLSAAVPQADDRGAGGARPTPGAPEGASPEERFRRAGAAYEAGRYEEAADGYQSLIDEGYDDPRLYYNLGNARFKQGRLGPSILGYERALARDPADADAKENLAYANLLITDKVGQTEEEFPARALRALERHFGGGRAVAVFAVLWILAGAVALPLWSRRQRTTRLVLGALLGLLLTALVLVGGIAAVAIARPGAVAHAIVLGSSVDGRSAPVSDGTVLFTIHEGLRVEIRGERAGWLQITLPNGSVGWIESTQAERV